MRGSLLLTNPGSLVLLIVVAGLEFSRASMTAISAGLPKITQLVRLSIQPCALFGRGLGAHHRHLNIGRTCTPTNRWYLNAIPGCAYINRFSSVILNTRTAPTNQTRWGATSGTLFSCRSRTLNVMCKGVLYLRQHHTLKIYVCTPE